MKKNLHSILFLIAGALFFISAMIEKNYTNIPLGICFIVLGISEKEKDN